MPGLLVDITTVMTCPHGGKITFIPAGPPVVLIDSKVVATAADQMTVVGCSLSGGGGTPCAKVQWSNIGQVLIGGKPVLLQAPVPPGPGNGLCLGSAAPGPPILQILQPLVTGV